MPYIILSFFIGNVITKNVRTLVNCFKRCDKTHANDRNLFLENEVCQMINSLRDLQQGLNERQSLPDEECSAATLNGTPRSNEAPTHPKTTQQLTSSQTSHKSNILESVKDPKDAWQELKLKSEFLTQTISNVNNDMVTLKFDLAEITTCLENEQQTLDALELVFTPFTGAEKDSESCTAVQAGEGKTPNKEKELLSDILSTLRFHCEERLQLLKQRNRTMKQLEDGMDRITRCHSKSVLHLADIGQKFDEKTDRKIAEEKTEEAYSCDKKTRTKTSNQDEGGQGKDGIRVLVKKLDKLQRQLEEEVSYLTHQVEAAQMGWQQGKD